jgi:hypothetical protein
MLRWRHPLYSYDFVILLPDDDSLRGRNMSYNNKKEHEDIVVYVLYRLR